MTSWKLIALAGLALVAACASAPEKPEPAPPGHEAQLREMVETIRTASAVPAIGIGVIDDGKIVFLGGFGDVNGRPATEHDRFRAASISKLFTAQATMKLAEAGRLSLDDDISRWLPAFAGRGLTVRHLLIHRSGLRDAVLPRDADDAARIQTYLDLLARQSPSRAPGEAYAYTDADFNVLGAVVERASGVSFTAYIQQNLLDPLGLADSAAFPTPAQREGVAPPFMNKPTLRPATPRAYDIAFAPSEGLVTSARDLTIWTQATLKQDKRLLGAGSFTAMLNREAEAEGPGRYAGLGWQLREDNGRRIAEHGGSVRGFNALVLTYPDEGRAIVILTNADDAPRWEIARKVDEILGPRP